MDSHSTTMQPRVFDLVDQCWLNRERMRKQMWVVLAILGVLTPVGGTVLFWPIEDGQVLENSLILVGGGVVIVLLPVLLRDLPDPATMRFTESGLEFGRPGSRSFTVDLTRADSIAAMEDLSMLVETSPRLSRSKVSYYGWFGLPDRKIPLSSDAFHAVRWELTRRGLTLVESKPSPFGPQTSWELYRRVESRVGSAPEVGAYQPQLR
jgi:hypothetical protein